MLADRRVKIVATMGPATQTEDALQKCIRAGMNVARLNFSHGSHEDHQKRIEILRRLSREMKAPVTILQDLQGPKIRVGKFKNGSIDIKEGEAVLITTREVIGEAGLIPSDFKSLHLSCKPGTKILLDDGLLELRVDSVQGQDINATVVYGGILKDRKGMNVPGASLAVECMSEKDLADLEFGLKNEVDYVALSFVRQGRDIRKLRELIQKKNSSAKIVAKIEMLEALENLEEIVRLSDVVMVARGDLAIEVGQSVLPGIQKQIITLCNKLGKPVITATQMLDSMVENPRPTRAEITDVANAVLDGSDACMLSAETASGKYPFKCIRTMHEIICEVERMEKNYYHISLESDLLSTAASIAASACVCALKLNAAAIVCLTTTGLTANIIAGYRPKSRLIAVTNDLTVLNKLELVWGLQTLNIQNYKNSEDVLTQVEQILIEYGLAKTGDKIILTYGYPVREGVKTNALQVYNLKGESLVKLADEHIPLRCQKEMIF
jgi:pyruvate kinase